MEINQRKDEGDMEGFERGSKYRLNFNIWKTEREWRLQKMHEAISKKQHGARKGGQGARK